MGINSEEEYITPKVIQRRLAEIEHKAPGFTAAYLELAKWPEFDELGTPAKKLELEQDKRPSNKALLAKFRPLLDYIYYASGQAEAQKGLGVMMTADIDGGWNGKYELSVSDEFKGFVAEMDVQQATHRTHAGRAPSANWLGDIIAAFRGQPQTR